MLILTFIFASVTAFMLGLMIGNTLTINAVIRDHERFLKEKHKQGRKLSGRRKVK